MAGKYIPYLIKIMVHGGKQAIKYHKNKHRYIRTPVEIIQ